MKKSTKKSPKPGVTDNVDEETVQRVKGKENTSREEVPALFYKREGQEEASER